MQWRDVIMMYIYVRYDEYDTRYAGEMMRGWQEIRRGRERRSRGKAERRSRVESEIRGRERERDSIEVRFMSRSRSRAEVARAEFERGEVEFMVCLLAGNGEGS